MILTSEHPLISHRIIIALRVVVRCVTVDRRRGLGE